MSDQQNISRIKAVYNALEELAHEVVFIGGAVVSLYSDRPAAEARPTDDVDILIELLNYKDYAAVEEKLRQKGFVNDLESGVICRYIIHGVTVDVMPSSGEILGFSNKWYPEAMANAVQVKFDDYTIRVFSTAYFIAAKLEAFKNRSKNDGRTSSDFEDIVFILNYRNAVWDEMKSAPQTVKQYLKDMFKKLLSDEYIYEAVSAHLEYNEQRRSELIIAGLNDFVSS